MWVWPNPFQPLIAWFPITRSITAYHAPWARAPPPCVRLRDGTFPFPKTNPITPRAPPHRVRRANEASDRHATRKATDKRFSMVAQAPRQRMKIGEIQTTRRRIRRDRIDPAIPIRSHPARQSAKPAKGLRAVTRRRVRAIHAPVSDHTCAMCNAGVSKVTVGLTLPSETTCSF